jgi:hypothetical protein
MSSRADLLSFFLQLTFGLALLAIALLIAAACYFNRKH